MFEITGDGEFGAFMTRLMSFSRLAAAAAMTLPLMAAGLGHAQAYGPNGPPMVPPDPSQYPPPDGYGPPPPQTPAQVEKTLRARLQLRPDQAPALHAFVQAVQPPADLQRRMEQDQEAARTMTTPQRMDLMVSNMDEMRRLLLARVAATKQFYAQLTPDQQRRFDAMGSQDQGPQDMGPGGMGPGGMGPGGMGPGGMGPGASQDRREPALGPNAPQAQGGFAE